VPQLGGVRIGDDGEIGANTCIDRGALEDTVLAEDVRLDNQIQIGHNVRIGAHTAMAGCAAVAGSATIGRYCLIGGGAGVVGHLKSPTRHRHGDVAGHAFDPRTGRILVGHADPDNRNGAATPRASASWTTLARRVNALQKDPQEPEA
jgi:carbonic anhydrase/acetyltransferase-like protein (isoleucine patch superfamily)